MKILRKFLFFVICFLFMAKQNAHSQDYNPQKNNTLPSIWRGNKENPKLVFQGDKDDPHYFYLEVKLKHGRIDAGSFVFELNGVRWTIVPEYLMFGSFYNGFNLFGPLSDGRSFYLPSDSYQRSDVGSYAKIIDIKEGIKPEFTIDMSELFFGNVKSIQRRFVKESSQSVLIEDRFKTNNSIQIITWSLLTKAEVEPIESGAIFRHEGKELRLIILEPEGLSVEVIPLPPILENVTEDPNSKVDITVPMRIFKKNKGKIIVRLTEN